jgi:hypothetical protein
MASAPRNMVALLTNQHQSGSVAGPAPGLLRVSGSGRAHHDLQLILMLGHMVH